jgi:hypothetical protein
MFATFNRPSASVTGLDHTIAEFVLDAFRSASRGSAVFGGVMNWHDHEFTTTLRGIIDDRGLKVRLVTGQEEEDEIDDDVKDLIDSIQDGVAAAVDPDGFMPHTKFFVFERLNFLALGQRQSEAAFAELPAEPQRALCMGTFNIGENHKHNAAVLVPISRNMFRSFEKYFDDLLGEYKEKAFPSPFREIISFLDTLLHGTSRNRYKKSETSLVKAYFFPRRPFEDTIVNILRNLQHFDNPVHDSCRIRIVNPHWTKGRIGVAKTLRTLNAHGASVEVISRSSDASEDDPQLNPEVAEILDQCSTRFIQGDGLNIHSKYMIIDGPYRRGDGFERQHLVWVGSPNLTKAAVRSHWELLLKLKHGIGASSRFEADFDFLVQNATVPAAVPA